MYDCPQWESPNAKVSGSPGFIGESDSTAGLEGG